MNSRVNDNNITAQSKRLQGALQYIAETKGLTIEDCKKIAIGTLKNVGSINSLSGDKEIRGIKNRLSELEGKVHKLGIK